MSTRMLVIDYFPEFHEPMDKIIPNGTHGRYIDKRRKYEVQVPAHEYEDIVDGLIEKGFDLAPGY